MKNLRSKVKNLLTLPVRRALPGLHEDRPDRDIRAVPDFLLPGCKQECFKFRMCILLYYYFVHDEVICDIIMTVDICLVCRVMICARACRIYIIIIIIMQVDICLV